MGVTSSCSTIEITKGDGSTERRVALGTPDIDLTGATGSHVMAIRSTTFGFSRSPQQSALGVTRTRQVIFPDACGAAFIEPDAEAMELLLRHAPDIGNGCTIRKGEM